ncbi:MAG: hypothetical protein WAJ97_06705 [Terriglobales bacterium]
MVSAGQNPPAGRPLEKGERAADVPTFFKKKDSYLSSINSSDVAAQDILSNRPYWPM